jgi:CarD family transcriptional regulator
MFKIGDTVLYGTTGVCKISDLVTREIGGKESSYFVLNPTYKEGCAVFVPADNINLTSKMRTLLSREEIEAVIQKAKGLPDIWENGDLARREKFTEILKSGDRLQVLLLVRSIYNAKQARLKEGKRLHLTDERLFTEAERLICDEFSAVLGIPFCEVIPFIIKKSEE